MQTRSPTLRCLDVAADLDDRPRRLVAEHHRRIHHERADLAVRVIVHVAAADADRVDLHLHVVRPDLLRQVDVAERELVLALENQCAHGYHPSFVAPDTAYTNLLGRFARSSAAICSAGRLHRAGHDGDRVRHRKVLRD